MQCNNRGTQKWIPGVTKTRTGFVTVNVGKYPWSRHTNQMKSSFVEDGSTESAIDYLLETFEMDQLEDEDQLKVQAVEAQRAVVTS